MRICFLGRAAACPTPEAQVQPGAASRARKRMGAIHAAGKPPTGGMMVYRVERAKHDRRMVDVGAPVGVNRRRLPDRRTGERMESSSRSSMLAGFRGKLGGSRHAVSGVILTSTEEAAAWAEQHGGEKALIDAIEIGTFGGDRQSNAYARLWLLQQEDARRNSSAQEERDLLRREVAAAENCAASARKSSDAAMAALQAARQAARQAQRLAFGAMAVALLAAAMVLVK